MKPCNLKRSSIFVPFTIAALLVVFGFQNCARPEFSFDVASRSVALDVKSSQAPICGEENLFSVDIAINDHEKFHCLDETKLSKDVTEGAVCESGPVVKAFQVMSKVPQDCERTTMCGVAPVSTEKKYEDGKIVYTLKYQNLPLGCEGKVKVIKTESLLVESEQQVNVEVPACSYCQFESKYTCGYCNAPKSCTTPWGSVLAHGASVNGAAYGVVPYNQECSFQQLSCNDGVLSGNATTYRFATCSKQSPKVCTTPWGEVLAHGGVIAAAARSSVPFGQTCAYQNVGCTDGLLSPNSSVYKYRSCVVQGATNCTTPWGASLGHGSSVDAFTTSSVSFGQSCSSQKITCSSGSLSANSASHRYASCVVNAPASCTSPWGTVPSGYSNKAYLSSAPDGPCSEQIRTCTNGIMSGTYTATTCTPAVTVRYYPSFPDGKDLAKDGDINTYASASTSGGTAYSFNVFWNIPKPTEYAGRTITKIRYYAKYYIGNSGHCYTGLMEANTRWRVQVGASSFVDSGTSSPALSPQKLGFSCEIDQVTDVTSLVNIPVDSIYGPRLFVYADTVFRLKNGGYDHTGRAYEVFIEVTYQLL